MRSTLDLQRRRSSPEIPDPVPGSAGRFARCDAGGVVRIDDGEPARRHDPAEQAQLGVEIAFEVGVVVEMVAREIGEHARRDLHAVEAALVQAVAGRFQRHAVDAGFGQPRQVAVQLHGVGRRKRAVARASGGDKAERAETGRRQPEKAPQLPDEIHRRRLAAGAGNGGDVCRLGAEEPGRQPGEQPARRVVENDLDIRRQRAGCSAGRREDRLRAPCERVRDKGAPVLPCARHGHEQVSRQDLAGIGRQAADAERVEVDPASGRGHYASLSRKSRDRRRSGTIRFIHASESGPATGTPRIDPMRGITAPATGTAFQAAVAKL